MTRGGSPGPSSLHSRFSKTCGLLAIRCVGQAQDARAGAVVLLQHDDLESRIVLLEPGQVLRPGAAPGVDGLVVVADHGEGPARADQLPDQLVLGAVGVLVLVDQQVADAPLPGLQQVRVVAKQARRAQDQVVEVHRVVGAQAALVVGVEPGESGLVVVLGLAQGLLRGRSGRSSSARCAPATAAGLMASCARAAAQVLLDQGLGSPGRRTARSRGAVRRVGVLAAQDVQPQGVEGGDGQAPAVAPLDLSAAPARASRGRPCW